MFKNVIDNILIKFFNNDEFGIIKYLNKQYYSYYYNYKLNINGIIFYSNLIEWYCKYFNINKSIITLNWGVKNNFLNVVKYFKNDWSCYTFKQAINYNKIDIINYLFKYNCNWNASVLAEATIKNNLKITKFLKNNGCPSNIWTSCYAAKSNNIKLLKWVIENGCEYNSKTFKFASISGNITIMNYLKSLDCPYDSKVYEWACRANKLNILEWLYINNYSLDNIKVFRSISSNNSECVIWLINNSNYNYDLYKCIQYANKRDNKKLHIYLTNLLKENQLW